MKPFKVFLQLLMAAKVTLAYTAINVTDIPTCALPCIVQTLTQTTCSLTDFACVCSEASFVSQNVMPCLLANCTMTDALKLAKIQAFMCDQPAESRQNLLYRTTIAGLIITTLFITLRLVTRGFIQKKLGLDDWLLMAGMGVGIFDTVIIIRTVNLGLGLHMWQVNAEDVPKLLASFLIAEACYPVILALNRISPLVFYLRIFPTRSFQRMVKCFIASAVIVALLYLFLIVFQCNPVEFAWKKDTPTPGTCLNMNALAYSGAVISFIYDVSNLLVPINEIRKLQMSTSKRLEILIMFSLGSCGCIASFIRLKSIASFSGDINNDPDITWTNVDILFWTEIEFMSAVAFACSPYIKVLISHVAHKQPQEPTATVASFFTRYTHTRRRGYSEANSIAEIPGSVQLPDRGHSDSKPQNFMRFSEFGLEVEAGEISLAEPKPVVKKEVKNAWQTME